MSNATERWLRSAMHNASDMITVLEADRIIRYVSPAAQRILGYRPEELVGTFAFDYVHPEDVEFLSNSFAEALEKPGLMPPIEFRLLTKDGSWRHVEVIRNNQLDNPAVKGMVTTTRDITERQRSEERLRRQYNGFPIPTFSWRRVQDDFELVDYNEAADRITLGRLAGLLGVRASEWYSDEPQMLEMLSRCFSEGITVQCEIPWWMRTTGEHKHFAVTFAYVPPDLVILHAEDVTERKRAEEGIRFQAKLLNAVGQAVIATDLQGKVLFWNRAAEELYGWSEEEVMGRSITEVTSSKEMLEQAEEIMSELVAGRRWSGEFEVRRKDCTTFPAMVTDTPVHDEQGNLIAIIGVSTDITEIKKNEELRRSEEHFRSLVQNASDVIYVVGADGTVRYVSPTIERMLGYMPKERMGRSSFELLHPDDLPRAKSKFAEALQNPGLTLMLELRMRHRDGTWRHVELNSTNLLDDPVVGGIVLNWRDITEGKRAEKRLKESEEQFRQLAENAQDLVYRYRFKPTPGFEYVSPSATAILGYTPEEHYADPELGYKIVHPDDRHLLEEVMHSLESPFTLRWLRKDGELVWTEQRNKLIYDEVGELVALEGIARDITERKRVEEDLRKTQEFITGILDNAPFPIYSVSEEGRMRLVNRFFADFVGMPQEKVVGSLLEDVFTEDEARQFREINQKVIGTETPVVEEEWTDHPNGRRYHQTIKFPLRDSDRGADAVGGISIDFTEHKRAQEALRESEERFRSTFEKASIGMSVSELNGRLLQVNRSLCQMLGYSEEELLATTFLTITHPEDVEANLGYLRLMLDGEIDGFQMEKRYLHAEGHMVWVLLNASVVKDTEGEPLYLIGQIQDITERKEAEREKVRQAHHAALRADVNAALAEGGTLRSILQQCTERMVCLLEAAFARIWTLNEGENVLELEASAGMYTHLDGTHSRVPLGEYKKIALIGQERRPYLTNDVSGDSRISDKEWAEREGIVSFAGHPLVVEGQLVGVMAMFVREPLKEDAIEALASVADAIAQGIKRKRADEALKKSEKTLTEAQRLAHLGNSEWNLKTGEVYWSEETYRIYGFEPNEFSPTFETVEEVFHPDDRHLFRATIEDAYQEAESYDFEHRIVRPDGEVRWLQRLGEVVRGEGGEPLRIICTVQDITQHKALEGRLEYQAYHDELTGLPNRRLFMDRLKQALRRNRRRKGGHEVAVLYLDLDSFKVVNDSLGHESGDLLLVAVAERLRSSMRPEDTLARFGGDEFAVLVEEIQGPEDAVRVAERIIEASQESYSVEGREYFIKPSIGIALGIARQKTAEDLLRDADTAMYQVKGQDEAYQVFDPGMYEQALRRLKLESDLRRAIADEEFVVYYQPIVNLQTGEASGVEALVRWDHPEHQGLLAPSQFIPVAEEAGLVVPMGRWVLEEACRQGAKWQQELPHVPPLVVSVNLSARQLQHPDVAEMVQKALKESGLDARYLSLDITETVYIEALEGHISALDKLKKMGVSISIDDFGTGYSSLAYLKRLPAVILKIDRSFIKGIGKDPEDTAIVRMIIELAHTLGMEVIAEGVESEEQAEQLKEMGCDRGQGYYFAKPLPSQEATRFLAR